ncbi:hypothetical protein BKA70DRAFT_885247 [Coprinopsis sp. MPI-PUGE-AT-0042]|nr:hypothetical protein BKA70DRAFT_885247 [Coprinopsis sp. MPI-PUGE-AT-0042]
MVHATAIQEKHKFDAFVNHFKMQSARAVARVWLSGSSDILAAARDRSSYASELEPCGERLSRKWPTVCSSDALACKSGPHGRGTGVTDARTTAATSISEDATASATSAIPLHDDARLSSRHCRYPANPNSRSYLDSLRSLHRITISRLRCGLGHRAICPPGQSMFAVSQGNAGRTTTGTPVPGGQMGIANALRSPQQMQQPIQTLQMQNQQF